MRHLCEIKIATYRRYTDLSVMGVRVGVGNLFLDQSIGIDENNTFQNENITFQLIFYSSTKTVGATVLGN